LRPLRWRDALVIGAWRYTGEYAFYDLGRGQMVGIRLFNPLMRALGFAGFYAVDDETGALAGVFSFIRHGAEIVEIGLAMRPTLTGQGQGLAFVQAGMVFGRAQYAPKRFSLLVATFNRRAQVVYERAGFAVDEMTTRSERGRKVEYLKMSRPAD